NRCFGVTLACAALGLSLVGPKDARACTTAQPQAELHGYPTDGEADVPTDVVPFYNSHTARVHDVAKASFTLVSSEEEAIAVNAEASYAGHVELVPVEPLQPNTIYRIDLSLPSGESVKGVSFTTGDGPFEGALPSPTAFLQHYQFSPDVEYSTCDPQPTGTCVALGTCLPLESSHLSEGNVRGIYVYLYERPTCTTLSGLEQGTPSECISLRSRAPNRTYSAAVQLCRDDGPLLTVNSAQIACTADGLLVQNASPPPREQEELDESEASGDTDGGEATGDTNESEATGDSNESAATGDTNESVRCSLAALGSTGTSYPFALLLAAAALAWITRHSPTRPSE